jgi:hypothetical protein
LSAAVYGWDVEYRGSSEDELEDVGSRCRVHGGAGVRGGTILRRLAAPVDVAGLRIEAQVPVDWKSASMKVSIEARVSTASGIVSSRRAMTS